MSKRKAIHTPSRPKLNRQKLQGHRLGFSRRWPTTLSRSKADPHGAGTGVRQAHQDRSPPGHRSSLGHRPALAEGITP